MFVSRLCRSGLVRGLVLKKSFSRKGKRHCKEIGLNMLIHTPNTHFECWLCAIFSPNTHLLVLNHWCSLSFLFTPSYFLSVYIHTHSCSQSQQRCENDLGTVTGPVYFTRRSTATEITGNDVLFFKSCSFSPVGNRWKGYRSFGERHNIIAFENMMNLIYLSSFSKFDFFGSSHLRREETEKELSLLCFFSPSQQLNPSSVLPDRNSFRTFW